VALNDAETIAQMRVTVKPAGGTGVVAVLQSDVNQFTGTASAILGNVQNVSAPGIKAQGTIPVIGTCSELLNTSHGQSAFIDFRQDSTATTQAAGDGGTMIDSML
jgi:hypothetical protein